MKQRRSILVSMTILTLLTLVLTAGGALAQSGAPDVTVPYSSRLTDETGKTAPDGRYDFQFALYDAETDGQLLWSETQSGVTVEGGALNVSLGAATALSNEVRERKGVWLAVSLRGSQETTFTLLSPRQSFSGGLSVPTAVSALACPHSHFGDYWSGSGVGLHIYSSNDTAVWSESNGGWAGVDGRNTTGIGVYGYSNTGAGVNGRSNSGTGAVGRTLTTTGATTGVWGQVASSATYPDFARGVVGWATKATGLNYGVWGQSESSNGTGVYGQAMNASCTASYWGSTFCAGVDGVSDKGTGVTGQTTSGVAVYANSGGSGVGLKVEGQYSGNLIEAWHGPLFPDRKFYVSSTGDVYADGTLHTPAADMAEMLAATGTPEAGDVLIIGADGQLARSTQANQASVVGVYSTKPGFVGGAGDAVDLIGKVPLAVVGVVPVKVSAESGAIQPGDLLVASSLPGHAMRAPANPAPGTVIGKALGTLDSGAGIVQMLVMLR